MSTHDLLIVGAGPAGMAAAVTARQHGLDVVVVDDLPTPGGQIWRGVETTPASRGALLGAAYRDGAARAAAFRAAGVAYEPGTQLWQIEPGELFRCFVSRDRQARMIQARSLIIATGAQERPVPFPGWTLPGVLTVGAGQILLKASGQVPTEPVWIAGSGPLVLLYMTQLLRAGGRIAGFLDTTPKGQTASALGRLKLSLPGVLDLAKGLAWSATLRLRGVKIVHHVADIAAIGTDRLTAVRYRTEDGTAREVPATVLLVHEGVIPSVHVPMALGCAMAWQDDQDCYAPVLDSWGETSQADAFVAGDGAGIGGARAAELRGSLAALRVAQKLGRLDAAETVATPLRRQLAAALALRPFLNALYRPRKLVFEPTDETIVCRCEEITAGQIRAMAAIGTPGPNQVKAFTRAGMGPCQGRQCGYTVTRLLASAENRPAADIGFYRVRPPLKPVTLGELASLDQTDPVA